MKTSETLNKAIENLKNGSWYSPANSAVGGVGSVCASLAISEVYSDASIAAHESLLHVIGHPTAHPVNDRHLIYNWNDAEGQTKENVILALSLASLHAELDEIEEAKRSQLAVEHSFALVAK